MRNPLYNDHFGRQNDPPMNFSIDPPSLGGGGGLRHTCKWNANPSPNPSRVIGDDRTQSNSPGVPPRCEGGWWSQSAGAAALLPTSVDAAGGGGVCPAGCDQMGPKPPPDTPEVTPSAPRCAIIPPSAVCTGLSLFVFGGQGGFLRTNTQTKHPKPACRTPRGASTALSKCDGPVVPPFPRPPFLCSGM